MEPQKFIAIGEIVLHRTLPGTTSIQFTSTNPICLKSNLICSPHLHLSLFSSLLASAFPNKIPHLVLKSHIRATCLAKRIHVYLPTLKS
jgi:hypothetical protein